MKTVKVNQSRTTVCNPTCTLPVGLRSILPSGSPSKMCRYPLTMQTAQGINILFHRTALSQASKQQSSLSNKSPTSGGILFVTAALPAPSEQRLFPSPCPRCPPALRARTGRGAPSPRRTAPTERLPLAPAQLQVPSAHVFLRGRDFQRANSSTKRSHRMTIFFFLKFCGLCPIAATSVRGSGVEKIDLPASIVSLVSPGHFSGARSCVSLHISLPSASPASV